MRLPSGSTWAPSRRPYSVRLTGWVSGPMRVKRVGVSDVEVGRCGVGRVVIGVGGQVDAQPVAVGEPVIGSPLVGERAKAERGVVREGRGEVCDGEDRVKAPQLPRTPRAGCPRGEPDALDLAKGVQSAAHRVDVGGADALSQLGVDGLHAARDGGLGLLAGLRQRQAETTAILWVLSPHDKAPADQRIDELTDRLPGDAEVHAQIASPAVARADSAEDEGPVTRQVLGADRVQLGADGACIRAAGDPHQRRI
jgi:hypothetical protein